MTKAGRLQTRNSRTILESESPKSSYLHSHAPPAGSEEGFHLAFSTFRRLLMFLGSASIFPLCMSPCGFSSYKDTGH